MLCKEVKISRSAVAGISMKPTRLDRLSPPRSTLINEEKKGSEKNVGDIPIARMIGYGKDIKSECCI